MLEDAYQEDDDVSEEVEYLSLFNRDILDSSTSAIAILHTMTSKCVCAGAALYRGMLLDFSLPYW